jgi:hypothetical protein
MRPYLLCLILLTVGCGSSPTSPPPPAPILPASLVSDVSVDVFPESGSNGWTLVWGGVNRGTGCATGVKGTMTVLDAQRTPLGVMSWTLDPTTMLRPNQSFTARACCLGVTADRLNNANATATYDWRDVACP